MHVAIDAGHNSPPADTGATGLAFEDTLTKPLAAAIAKLLIAAGHTVTDCAYPRSKTLVESLAGRVEIANRSGADLYLSLHFNKYLDGVKTTTEAMGTEVFAISESSKKIADRVLDKIVALGFKRRSVKDSGLYVLIHTDMPAILVESFFLDSIADFKLFEKVGIDKIATAIVAGVLNV